MSDIAQDAVRTLQQICYQADGPDVYGLVNWVLAFRATKRYIGDSDYY